MINKIRLIDDVPSTTDDLGAHSRLAQTIYELISSNNGGKTLSIEGEWGAGKSSVIKQVCELFKNNNDNVYIMNYDAWVHNGDPLRRAFLETLIDELLENNWLSGENGKLADKYWENQKNKLSNRRKTIKKKNVPKYTKGGKYLISSILVAPIFLIISNSIINAFAKPGYKPEVLSWVTLVSFLVLAFSPVIILAFQLILAKLKNKNSDEVFAIVFNKSTVKEKSDTTESSEPTTIEFQHVFESVVSNALSDSKRKLVLVIDNLDRLEESDRKMVWSLLRSFIDNPTFRNEVWVENLWVVVPISNDNTSSNSGSINGPEFLEKVFQVRLKLPPPLLIDWKNYLLKLLNSAFPNESSSEFLSILTIYEIYVQASFHKVEKRPTPRSLILFINEMVVLKIQWGSAFSLSLLAAYLTSTKQGNVVDLLRSKTIPSKQISNFFEYDISRQFAALYFNINDLDKAQEVLIKPKLVEALNNANSEYISSDIYGQPFNEAILRTVLIENVHIWARDDLNRFFNSILALGEGSSASEETKKYSSQVYSLALRDLSAIPLKHPSLVAAIRKLISMCDANLITKYLLQSLKKFEEPVTEKNEFIPEVEDDASLWISNLEALCRIGPIHDAIVNEDGKIILPVNVIGWSELCLRWIAGDLDKFLDKFEPVTSSKSAYITNLIKSNSFGYNAISMLKIEERLGNSSEFKQIVNAQEDVFKQDSYISMIGPLLYTNLLFKFDNDIALSQISGYIDSGLIYHHFYSFYTNKDYYGCSILLAVLMKLQPSLQKPPLIGNSPSGHSQVKSIIENPSQYEEVVSNLVKIIGELGLYRIIIDFYIFNKEYTNFISSLVASIDRSKIYDKFDANVLAQELGPFSAVFYRNSMTQYRKSVITHFIDKYKLIKILESQSISFDVLWLFVSGYEISNSNDIRRKLVSFLNLLTADDYERELRSYTWTLKILIDLIKSNTKLSVHNGVSEALLRIARLSSSSPEKVKISVQNVESLTSILSQDECLNLYKGIYEFSCTESTDHGELFFSLFGSIISSYVLKNKKKISFTEKFIYESLRPRKSDSLKWLVHFLEINPYKSIDNNKESLNLVLLALKKKLTNKRLTLKKRNLLEKLRDLIS